MVVATPAQPVPAPIATDEPERKTFAAPTFYITGRQTLSPASILLAFVAAACALFLVIFALSHARHEQVAPDEDDPNQVDTVVLGDPQDAPAPAHPGDHPSTVHPTILVHLPRWGEKMGMIPNSPAGQLLFNWLAAFNKPSYRGLMEALPSMAPTATTDAQMELRRETGGFSLLSAKEVVPGVLVFRLHDQTPSGTDVLGTLQMRPNSNPATIESFSLRAVPTPAPAR